MADFPPRTPEGRPHQARVFSAHYFGARNFAMVGVLFGLLGTVAGILGSVRFALLNPLSGALLGALFGGLVFNFLGRVWIKKSEEAINQFHRSKAEIREMETQKQMAEMKAKEALK